MVANISSQPFRGLNLPSQRADTNQGNFLPGLFNYSSYAMAKILGANFTALRLGLNVQTAHHRPSLEILRGYIDKLGPDAEPGVLLCMWDTLQPGEHGHGDGRVNNVTEMGAAWKVAAAAFAGTRIKFEIFNEPFGYSSADGYLSEMLRIVSLAELPLDRVVLDGMGYAQDPAKIAGMWPGWLAYHLYPNWLPDGARTQERFSNLVQGKLQHISSRTLITEFGASLSVDVDYEKYQPSGWGASGDVNMLRGLDDAVTAFRNAGNGVLGAYHWHGWDNGDSYSFWGRGYRGRVQRVLRNL